MLHYMFPKAYFLMNEFLLRIFAIKDMSSVVINVVNKLAMMMWFPKNKKYHYTIPLIRRISQNDRYDSGKIFCCFRSNTCCAS